MRYALSILALMIGTPAIAQSEPVRPVPVASVQTKDGLAIIILKTPGLVHLCATSPSMDVTTSGRRLTVRGGRMCEANETPSLILNTSPSNCSMLGGRNTGNLNMNCTGKD